MVLLPAVSWPLWSKTCEHRKGQEGSTGARGGAADAQTYFVSVGNHQPTANMYPNLAAVTDQNSGQSPPLHRTDSQGNATAEALANVRAAATEGDG
eukprot:COSAG04_NODE_5446_length_1617_cov_1.649539_3_plen_95_part_01